jgi:hypothetical protein
MTPQVPIPARVFRRSGRRQRICSCTSTCAPTSRRLLLFRANNSAASSGGTTPKSLPYILAEPCLLALATLPPPLPASAVAAAGPSAVNGYEMPFTHTAVAPGTNDTDEPSTITASPPGTNVFEPTMNIPFPFPFSVRSGVNITFGATLMGPGRSIPCSGPVV